MNAPIKIPIAILFLLANPYAFTIPVKHPAKQLNIFTILYKSFVFAFYKYFDKGLESPSIEDMDLSISGFDLSMFIAAKQT